MISKIVYVDGRTYLCDDCRRAANKFKSYKEAIAAGWAVSRDYTKCYCPNCAPNHRHVGRRGAKPASTRSTFPPLKGQINIFDNSKE